MATPRAFGTMTRAASAFSNVAANSDVTLNLPVGRTYHKVQLLMGGTTFTRAMLTDIEVVINGRVVMAFADGDELQAYNDYYGRADNAGYLTLYFERPELRADQQEATALGTADVQTLQIRASIAAATDPTLVARYVTSAPSKLGAFVKVRSFSANSAVSGEIDIDGIPTGPAIVAMHLFKADISAIDVEMDGVKVVDGIDKADMEIFQGEWGRAPVTASATHVDFCLNGDLRRALVTRGAQDFRLRPTLDTSGAVRILVEYLDGWGGL